MTGDNRVVMASLGGVKLVLLALDKHPSNVGIQETGLHVIGGLARNGSLGGCWFGDVL